MFPLEEVESVIIQNSRYADLYTRRTEFNNIIKNYINGTAIDGAGDKWWYKNGLVHRDDGPAYESSEGTKQWIKNGELHREDGPAIEWENGDRSWHLNGIHHREDGPASIGAKGDKAWYLNGKLHRTDGPAVISCNGKISWHLNGTMYSEQEYHNKLNDFIPDTKEQNYEKLAYIIERNKSLNY